MKRLLEKYGHMICGFSDERAVGEGYFIYLTEQYIHDGNDRTIHEYTLKECEYELKFNVEKI